MRKIVIPDIDIIESRRHSLNAVLMSPAKDKNSFYRGFDSGIAYANEQIEKERATAEPWQPETGMKCAFWDGKGTVQRCDFGELTYWSPATWPEMAGIAYDHCAALESLDEIGKPPSYFIERGRCTVAK